MGLAYILLLLQCMDICGRQTAILTRQAAIGQNLPIQSSKFHRYRSPPNPMIDRHARDKLALALRRYAARRITNDELEAAVGTGSEDRGVTVVQDMAWQLYDDLCCHRADGPHALPKDTRRSVARWVLFLRTDHEYAWPDHDFRQCETSMDRFLAGLFTAGRWSRKKREEWESFFAAGNFEVWPFLNLEDEEGARNAANKHSR